MSLSRQLSFTVLFFVITSMPAAAQPIGTYKWQMQPYCNVLTLAVTQNGTVFTLDGVDDLCGAGPASAVGTAFFKPDGTVGMGLHLVTTPGAAPVHVSVVLDPATLGGTWTDSGGHSGSFLFNPTLPGGAPRPAGGGLASVAVTTVIAGAGLTGGGMGPVDLAVAFAGSGAATTAARSDHTHAKGPGSTAVGQGALEAITTGENNTALGHLALSTNIHGGRNTAVGAEALRHDQEGGNTAVGYKSLTNSSTGVFNTAVGDSALANNGTGTLNTAVGGDALFKNTHGHAQTALGYLALYQATGGFNLALGSYALSTLTSGCCNIGIGSTAGINITTGSDNIVIGHEGGAGAESDTIRLGTPGRQTRAFVAGVRGVTTATAAIPVLVGTDGQLGTISSSRRFKQDIADLGDAGLKLHQLRPVQFRYAQASADAPGPLQYRIDRGGGPGGVARVGRAQRRRRDRDGAVSRAAIAAGRRGPAPRARTSTPGA